MKKIVAIVITIIIGLQFSWGNNVIIKGNAPDYAGDKLEIKKYTDRISFAEETLVSAIVEQNGDFYFNFPVNQTIYAFMNLGVYRGLIFLEPGKNYEIVLPPKVEKQEKDLLNPYFNEESLFIGVKNLGKDNLNYYIREFNAAYNTYLDKNFVKIFKLGYNSDVDKQIKKLDSLFSHITHPYFLNYKKYKYAQLRHIAYERDTEKVQKKYFINQKVLHENVAYMNFFNKTFENYLYRFANTLEGDEAVKAIVQQQSFTALKSAMDSVFAHETLKELVILKGIHDAYYEKSFPQDALFTLLDSAMLLSKIPVHKTIAKNIKAKITALLENYPAPEFALYDRDSNLVKLSDFSGRFVYLAFVNSKSYECQKDFGLLKNFQEKYKEYFDVVTISTDKDFDAMKQLAKEKGYNWKMLHFGNQKYILKDYKIRAYPMYFLIHPNGNLTLSPALGPDEDFEAQFGVIYQQYTNQKRREQAQPR